MSCFSKLKESGFFSNASSELESARRALNTLNQSVDLPQLFINKAARKRSYDYHVDYLYLLDELIATVGDLDKSTVYYMHVNEFIFVYSINKKLLNDAITYTYNLDGNIPMYTSKHKIENKVIYTALFDTRMVFTPSSPN